MNNDKLLEVLSHLVTSIRCITPTNGSSISTRALESLTKVLILIDEIEKEISGSVDEKPTRTPLFKTSDGVDIFEGDSICLLNTDSLLMSYPVRSPQSPFYGDKNQFKYFSTREAAQSYIDSQKKGKKLMGDMVNVVMAGEPTKETRCGICGGGMVFIRGRYPNTDKREVCPTCTTERLEQIQEISNPNYGKTYKSNNL